MSPKLASSGSPCRPPGRPAERRPSATSAEIGLILVAAVLMVAISAIYGLMPQT